MEKRSEKGYAVVFILCMTMIAAMLLSMAITVKKSAAPTKTHRPPNAPLSGEELAKTPEKFPVPTPFPMPSTVPEAPGAQSLTLTEEQFSEIVLSGLPEDFPLEDLEITFLEDNLRLTGKCKKTSLISFMEQSRMKLPAIIGGALVFLPEDLTIESDFLIRADKDTGLLDLTAERLTINGAGLPDDVASVVFSGAITSAVNAAICESGLYFTGIRISDGMIELLTTPV